MLVKNYTTSRHNLDRLLRRPEKLVAGDFRPVVKKALAKRAKILRLAKNKTTPFYAFDRQALASSAQNFQQIFSQAIPNVQTFYAVKANYYPGVLAQVVKSGLNLDVSSGRELNLALKTKAKKIIFSGPGKSEADLKLATKYPDKIIIQLDSLNELKLLAKVLGKNKTMRAGIRVYTSEHGSWSKFGIPLNQLKNFIRTAQKYPQIKLQGIQSHMSLVGEAKVYEHMIREIGEYLQNNFRPQELAQIKFIDLGGGFIPYHYDGFYPWDTDLGRVFTLANESVGANTEFKHKYYFSAAEALTVYAHSIARASKKYFKFLPNIEYYFEPGRIIVSDAMHLVLRIADYKAHNILILDGGINMVGWDQFLDDYYPIINFSQPALSEIKTKIYGSLCLPQDFFGHYCFAKRLKVGDILVIPFQGAYTFTWAQEFIKNIPPVYQL